jgi:hypothetical protein
MGHSLLLLWGPEAQGEFGVIRWITWCWFGLRAQMRNSRAVKIPIQCILWSFVSVF